MPLYFVIIFLVALDGLILAATAAVGFTLDGKPAMDLHFKLGLLASFLTCFIHVLVIFYFIGTGKDIRDAVEDHPQLAKRYVPWTRTQKRRVFPPACFSLTFIILATLLGGEVHSRILAAGGGTALPFRGVTGWWIHLVLVIAALLSSGFAFYIEILAVRDNRRVIDKLNEALAARESG
ncbi:MAG TPA: hypothetical protein VMT52_17900 [Planctomycetota bacterium]|nr:hypothetical protein [Planctomycetota bacterium]